MDLIEIKVFHHSVVETDLSIHMYWKSEPGSQDKSPLGLRISSALGPLGLLNHSVWVRHCPGIFLKIREIQTPGHPGIG
jgi:hypothetical protein